jgi:hypothetical protein
MRLQIRRKKITLTLLAILVTALVLYLIGLQMITGSGAYLAGREGVGRRLGIEQSSVGNLVKWLGGGLGRTVSPLLMDTRRSLCVEELILVPNCALRRTS